MPFTVPEQKERNDELVKDYQEQVVQLGKPILDLVIKYGISSQRIYQILEKRNQPLKKGFRKPKSKTKKAK